MKDKLAKLKLVNLPIFGILVLVILAMPYVGYTYKKVGNPFFQKVFVTGISQSGIKE